MAGKHKTVGTASMMAVSEVKKAPMDAFDLARESGTCLYVTQYSSIVGVMLTQEQYDALHTQIADLEQRVAELSKQ